jgi:hypothetical protein
VRINEVCASPRQDWSDSEGGNGVPYDLVPGTGPVRSEDEWIELLNASGAAVDLRGWEIVTYPGPTLLQSARSRTGISGGALVVGGTLAAVNAGGRVIVGDPGGSLASSLWIELRDPNGILRDAVEIGGNSEMTDRGGDGVGNGAPGPGLSGESTGPADEAVARVPDGADTGDAGDDFEHAIATPGAAN